MDAANVLVWDLGTDSAAGENVRAILETDSYRHFTIRQEVLHASEGPAVVRRAAEFRSKFCPALSFLLCGAAPPPAAEELIKALRADSPDRPVFVVAEAGDPTVVAEAVLGCVPTSSWFPCPKVFEDLL